MGGSNGKITGHFYTESNKYPRYSDTQCPGEQKGFDAINLQTMGKNDAGWEHVSSAICNNCNGDCPDPFISLGHPYRPCVGTASCGNDPREVCQRVWNDPDTLVACCSGAISGAGNCPPGHCVQSSLCKEVMKTQCPRMVGSNVTWDAACDAYIDKAPLQHANDVIESAVSDFLENHPVTEYQHQFGEKLQKLCGDRPGMCDSALKTACAKTNRSTIENNTNSDRSQYIQNICGCFLDDTPGASQYDKYRGQVSKTCDPICRASKIKPGHEVNGQWVSDSCVESNCIIDNLTLNLLEGSNSTPLNITQVCSNAGNNSNFQCLISGADITSMSSKIKSLNLCQACKGGIKTNPDKGGESNTWIDYECPTTGLGALNSEVVVGSKSWVLWILLAVIMTIVVVIYLKRKK